MQNKSIGCYIEVVFGYIFSNTAFDFVKTWYPLNSFKNIIYAHIITLTSQQWLVKLEQRIVYIKDIIVALADKIFDDNVKLA